MASLNHYASSLFAIMGLTGLGCLLFGATQIPGSQRGLFGASLVFLCVISIGFVNADGYREGVKFLGKMSYFLTLPLLYVLFSKNTLSLIRSFAWGLVFAAPLNLFIALHSFFVQRMPRAKGYYNPIIFGDLMMFAAVLLLVFVLAGIFRSRLSVYSAGLASISFLLCSFLSGTRGAFLVVPALAGLLMFLYRDKLTLSGVMKLLLGMTIFVLLVCYIGANSDRNIRVSPKEFVSIYDNVRSYFKGGDVKNSAGQRLVMWEVAWEMLEKKPFFGAGLGGYEEKTRKLVEPGHRLVDSYSHAHNIYLQFLAETGIIGLLSMLMVVFLLPARIFIRALSGSEIQRICAVGGIVQLVCFALFGFTEAWLSRSPMVISYVVCVALFITGCSSSSVEERLS
jgi:O-antigen ligase